MPQARRLIPLTIASLLFVSPAFADELDVCASAAESAQPKRKAGQLTSAREDLVTCSRSVCPAAVREDCRKWLDDVDKALGSIIIRAVDESGKDLIDVEVTLDDKPLTKKLDGRPISLDPGVHTITYAAEGRAPVSEQLVIRETEKDRLVNVTLRSAAKLDEKPATPPPKPPEPVSPLAYVAGGVAVAAIGVGAALWIVGSGERSDMQDSCAKTSSCREDDIDAAKTKLVVGDVLMVVGAVAAAAGVYLVLSRSNAMASWRGPIVQF